MLSKNDLKQVIQRLIGFNNQFTDLDMEQLIQNILDEADLDDDGSLSFAEFEHVIDKSSDFTKWVRRLWWIKAPFNEFSFFSVHFVLDFKPKTSFKPCD